MRPQEPGVDDVGPAAPPRDNGELVFEAPWESRAFGVALALRDAGTLDFEAFRERLIGEIRRWEEAHGTGGDGYRYYERWAEALESAVLDARLVSVSELEREATAIAHARAHDHDHG